MMRRFRVAALCLLAMAQAVGPNTVAARATTYSSTNIIGTLLDNPATKAILERHIPEVVDNPRIFLARGLSLQELQKHAPEKLTKAKLDVIDAELSKVTGK